MIGTDTKSEKRRAWIIANARKALQAMHGLHSAVVEFGIGDSCARELGTETIKIDNVPLDSAANPNAIGSYILGSAPMKEVYENTWDDRTAKVLAPNKTHGKHRVLLDLDVPHVYIPSSTEGHGHLVIDVPQDWENLNKLLQLMGDMGILQYGYVDATKSRGESWLRAPGVSKNEGGLAL